ncbi:MAG: D-alanyl-D-alanine carboxypeptidase/D-alanyl-D-alanine-endopeptidase [Snowella sp.]|nr:D-alanyl-D-alanine carboxypeptidase/D-alanyl-D-alanine-endopeptidase [Snowella sp.]
MTPKVAIADSPLSQTVRSRDRRCVADIPQKIDTLLSQPELRTAHWGILVKNLQNQTTLYQRGAEQLFVPASNTKLLTTAAALVKSGENYRIKTPIYSQGEGASLNRLRIIGKGDPSLTTEQLKTLANHLKSQGIQQIKTLSLVETIAPQNLLKPTWEWEDIYFYYAPAVNQLILNQNTVNLTLSPQAVGQPLQVTWSDAITAKQWQIINQTRTVSGNPTQRIRIKGVLGQPVLVLEGELGNQSEPDITAIAIPDPVRYFADSLQQVLTEAGIQVGRVEITNNPAINSQEKQLLEIESPTLKELITEINQNSNNLYAESLLNHIQDSDNTAIESLKETLNSLKVENNQYFLKDGSGLSRQTLVSPTAFVQLLTSMTQSPLGTTYRDSLAIAGQTGTLKNRFLNTPVVGKLQGKTGTLSGAISLSGYLQPTDFAPLVFSILVNNSEQPASILRNAIDTIIIELSQLKPC